jgi:predicted phosphate transport protein (TIGR00153 family)
MAMLFGKLMPRDGNFFDLFNQHGDRIVEGARAFIQLIENYGDASLREKYTNEVGNAERQADRITAEVNRLLHKTFITPIDREQIHSLINAMDDILDLLQDATETMSLYDVKALTEEVLRLGVKAGSKLIDATVAPATERVAQALGIAAVLAAAVAEGPP